MSQLKSWFVFAYFSEIYSCGFLFTPFTRQQLYSLHSNELIQHSSCAMVMVVAVTSLLFIKRTLQQDGYIVIESELDAFFSIFLYRMMTLKEQEERQRLLNEWSIRTHMMLLHTVSQIHLTQLENSSKCLSYSINIKISSPFYTLSIHIFATGETMTKCILPFLPLHVLTRKTLTVLIFFILFVSKNDSRYEYFSLH